MTTTEHRSAADEDSSERFARLFEMSDAAIEADIAQLRAMGADNVAEDAATFLEDRRALGSDGFRGVLAVLDAYERLFAHHAAVTALTAKLTPAQFVVLNKRLGMSADFAMAYAAKRETAGRLPS